MTASWKELVEMVALGMGEMREKVLLMDTVLDRMSQVWQLTLALDIAQKNEQD